MVAAISILQTWHLQFWQIRDTVTGSTLYHSQYRTFSKSRGPRTVDLNLQSRVEVPEGAVQDGNITGGRPD
jgi:hypothetical protein